MAYTVMPYIVMTYTFVAHVVMACIVMAYTVMACIVMAYTIMAYIVMTYIVMAYLPCSHTERRPRTGVIPCAIDLDPLSRTDDEIGDEIAVVQTRDTA